MMESDIIHTSIFNLPISALLVNLISLISLPIFWTVSSIVFFYEMGIGLDIEEANQGRLVGHERNKDSSFLQK